MREEIRIPEVINNILSFKWLPEPRIALKDGHVINPAALMYNRPYSYDERIEESLTFFARAKYVEFFEPIYRDLTEILCNEDRFGLNIPEAYRRVKTIKEISVDDIVNHIISEVGHVRVCIIGLPSALIKEKYFELKARFLGENIRIQLIRDDDFCSIYMQASREGRRKILYNLATAIYTKLGGTPWILSEPMAEPNSIIVGIGFGGVEKGVLHRYKLREG